MSAEPSRPAAPDEYEASIAAPGEVVHRDKLVSRLLAWVCLAMMLLSFGAAAGGLSDGAPIGVGLGVGAVGLLFLFLGLTRTVLRTVVTTSDIRVQWGLWGPRIALPSVKAVSVRHDYSRQALIEAMREPGSPRIEMFALPPSGPILDLAWTDAESGRARRAWLGAGDAAALCEAIRRGVAAQAPSPARIAGAMKGERIAGAAAQEEAEEAAGVEEEEEEALSRRERAP